MTKSNPLSFDILASMGRRGSRMINSVIPKRTVTTEEKLQISLGPLARDDVCQEVLIPEIGKWIKTHESKQMEFIGNHSLLSYHKGVADGLKELRDLLTKCADPSE